MATYWMLKLVNLLGMQAGPEICSYNVYVQHLGPNALGSRPRSKCNDVHKRPYSKLFIRGDKKKPLFAGVQYTR